MLQKKVMPNTEINCKLIKEVKKYKFLYDSSEKNYRNALASVETWNKIGEALNMHAGKCRRRWYRLRSSLAASFEYDRPYYLAEELDFLIPHLTFIQMKKKPKAKQTGIEDLLLFLEDVFPYYAKLSQHDKLRVQHTMNVAIEEHSHQQKLEQLKKQQNSRNLCLNTGT